MERNMMIIYAIVGVAVIATASVGGYVLLGGHPSGDDEVKYPLGDPDYNFTRDVAQGTVYTMVISGTETTETFSAGVSQSKDDISISGMMTVTVTHADDKTFTFVQHIELQNGSIKFDRTYTVDRATETYVDDPVKNFMKLSKDDFPKIDPEVYDEWGPHSMDGNSYIYASSDYRYTIFEFHGKDDRVCYQISDDFVIGTKDSGETKEYVLTCVLDKMDFKKL